MSTEPIEPTGPAVLVVVAAGFGAVLRRLGVAVAPTEVIETARALAVLAGPDQQMLDEDTLRAALRAVTVKYRHENAAYDRAFDAFFLGRLPDTGTGEPAAAAGAAAPEGLELAGEDDPPGSPAERTPRANEVGDLLEAPDAGEEFNPHKDDDDFSLSTQDREFTVGSGPPRSRQGMTYTVQLERAGAAAGHELTEAAGTPTGELRFGDPAGVLAWLDAIDARSVYGAELFAETGTLSGEQLDMISDAVRAFVAELAARLGTPEPTESAASDVDGADGADEQRRAEQALYRRVAHEFLRRVRGAPRRRPRPRGHGKLDVHRTVRRSLRTDGVPFRVVVRRRVPGRVRLLIVADLSLSVRSITAFALRLAQTLHGMSHRCHVLAFVDSTVDVTERLLLATGERALAAVLGTPGLDLDASSDYGHALADVLGAHAGLLDSATTVLILGDGRCNGLSPGTEHLAELRRRVHRLGWITPEPRRYWTQAGCAMTEFAETCDSVVTARDAEELLTRMPELAAGL